MTKPTKPSVQVFGRKVVDLGDILAICVKLDLPSIIRKLPLRWLTVRKEMESLRSMESLYIS